ncbi:M48 family metalloprotease [Phenylobacterium sp.]|uniref:M48 family metalloprotease n=1 Tax=Phenylobacterium sp. TaxID=1871053 RepID=UPI0035B2CAB8
MVWRRTLRSLAALAAATGVALTGAPAQAQSRSSQEQQKAELVAQLGGRYEGPQQAYVARVGERVAAAAGRPAQCRFTLVNSEVVNAFAAPPGCDVYVTRGLLAILNSEDELAAVLGHEVGHVAANHSGRRQQRSLFTGLGALAVGVLTGSSELAQVASQVGQLNVLSYSRNQEFEADSLGLRYLAQTGYAPDALADLLRALQAEDTLENRLRGREDAKTTPVWGRTHPLTADRITRAVDLARRSGPPGPPERRDEFLSALDGLIYGDDPDQGFVDGRRFAHPQLGIAFEAPPGFILTNTPRAVKIEGPQGSSLAAEFSAGRAAGDLETYAQDVLRRMAGQTPVRAYPSERTRMNGVEAVVLPAVASTRSGQVEVTIAAYALGDRAFHFAALSPAGRSPGFDPLIGSFRRLSAEEARALRPRRIEVVTVGAGDTAESLARRMAFEDLRRERFELINGLQPGEPVRPGQRVKLVTSGRR